MRNERRPGYIKITAAVIILVFGLVLLLQVVSPFLGREDEAGQNEKASDEVAVQQVDEEIADEGSPDGEAPKKEVPGDEQPEKANDPAKYMTISQEGNIDIGVNYLTPITGDTDTLTFEVILGTHSVDLTEFSDVRKYVEIRTDTGVLINDGFEWELQSGESHHISGLLKIKNEIEGNPIVGPDTKSFKLVFKNIPDKSEREHVYEGEKLK